MTNHCTKYCPAVALSHRKLAIVVLPVLLLALFVLASFINKDERLEIYDTSSDDTEHFPGATISQSIGIGVKEKPLLTSQSMPLISTTTATTPRTSFSTTEMLQSNISSTNTFNQSQSLAFVQLRRWTYSSISDHFNHLATVEYSILEGLGNVMFTYASLLGIAQQYDIVPVIPQDMYERLSTAFELRAIVHPNHTAIPWIQLNERICCVHSPERFEPIASNKSANYVLRVFLQSFKYFQHIRPVLRSHELRFRADVLASARSKREAIEKKHCGARISSTELNKMQCLVIGIHNRRGDFLKPQFQSYGFAVADVDYFRRAMRHYLDKFATAKVHLVFAVISIDFDWNQANLANITLDKQANNSASFSIEVLPTDTTPIDMCFLTLCDHLIITGGTYSWWAAFLGKGEVVRMLNYPQLGSSLASVTNIADHYPPDWTKV